MPALSQARSAARPQPAAPEKSAALCGYLEGFYGRLLSFEDRHDILNHLAALGLNAYLYAPKEDPGHRLSWREPYGAAWLREFRAFTTAAGRKAVRVVAALAPGLSFDYRSRADYGLLLRKFRSLARQGAGLALLMDDIPEELPEKSRGHFVSLGEAHGLLLQNLRRDLGPAAEEFWFCPTVYSDAFSREPVAVSSYLHDLARLAPADTGILWTGPQIVSERIGPKDLKPLVRLFGPRLLLWDNLYANDYCTRRFFIGPMAGRHPDLPASCRGLLLNPTGLPETDKLLLTGLAAWRRGRSEDEAWAAMKKRHALPAQVDRVRFLFDSPFRRLRAADFPRARKEEILRALQFLVFQWKGVLHREWYPYLHALHQDMALVFDLGGEKRDRALFRASALVALYCEEKKPDRSSGSAHSDRVTAAGRARKDRAAAGPLIAPPLPFMPNG